jgi:A/G-specific adenine glycosylase
MAVPALLVLLFLPAIPKTLLPLSFLSLKFDMDNSNEITHDFSPFFKVYKDGRIERSLVLEDLPAGLDPETGVLSKDVVISPDSGVKARIFIPEIVGSDQKLPLLVHYHGGGFCVGSAFHILTKNVLTPIVSRGNVIAISIDYRLAPEHLLPIAYNDSWDGLEWIAGHSNGLGPEPWLNNHVDFGKVFLTGESAGANIAHYLAVQVGANGWAGLKLAGVILVHPFFGYKDVDEMHKYLCPTSSGGDDDPRLNPAVDPNLSKMGCQKALVCVAEKDFLRDRGEAYYKTLATSGWPGKVEFYETKGEDHCFNAFKQCGETDALNKKVVDFMTME